MKTAITNELNRLCRNSLHVSQNINRGVYTGEDVETAQISLSVMSRRIERCKQILRVRYGINC